MVCLNVFTRYVLKTPILASMELSRIFFIWACFLAAGLTFYRQAHIVISFVTDLMPAFVRRVTGLVVHLFMILFLAGISYWSMEVVVQLWNTEFPILEISQSWLYLPVTLSSVIMLSFNLEILYRTIPTDNHA
jgi:TRAP-type C4-dicarboxylate transport system permease small subunit